MTNGKKMSQEISKCSQKKFIWCYILHLLYSIKLFTHFHSTEFLFLLQHKLSSSHGSSVHHRICSNLFIRHLDTKLCRIQHFKSKIPGQAPFNVNTLLWEISAHFIHKTKLFTLHNSQFDQSSSVSMLMSIFRCYLSKNRVRSIV